MSSALKEALAKVLDSHFDKMALDLLGQLPKYRGAKSILFTSYPQETLAHLFVYSLGNKFPLPMEEEAMKGLLQTAEEYVESLRAKTKAKVINGLDSYIIEARKRNIAVTPKTIEAKIFENLKASGKDFRRIVASETTKVRNTANALEIQKMAQKHNTPDPTVVFLTMKDNITCLEENELVRTKKGIKKVGDLNVGDLLENPSQDRMAGCKITRLEKKDVETIELDFGDQKIICSKDHPILVRSKSVYFFMEADRINETHDVVIFDKSLSKGEKAKITRADTPKEFMINMGYDNSWDFWRENVDDMLLLVRQTKNRKALLQKYGIPLDIWNTYVRTILFAYDPALEVKGGCPNNNFNQFFLQQRTQKGLRNYQELGDDNFKDLISYGKRCADIAKEFGIPLIFLRKKIKSLNLVSTIRRKGGLANWQKNKDLLIQKMKERGTLHFTTVSKPEKEIFEYLKNYFPTIESSFHIGNMKVDLCIPEKKCVIEYDGSGHNLRDKIAKNEGTPITDQTDYKRDLRLKKEGYRILRIKAPKDQFDLEKIKEVVSIFVGSGKRFDKWHF